MGTKRQIASRVRDLILDTSPTGRVVDLFSGIGCVAESLAGVRHVATNDALEFTASLARARFTAGGRVTPVSEASAALKRDYREHVERLASERREILRSEQRALGAGAQALGEYIDSFRHVANDDAVTKIAANAATSTGHAHYCLATTYFAGGYFSLRQAIQIDALRFAIDAASDKGQVSRDRLLAAWLAAAARVINAPGHTAQFLRPNNTAGYARISRMWTRNIWSEFQERLVNLTPVGTSEWRRRNQVIVSDALDLVSSNILRRAGAIYADPPYTKDQYSRYYHVYETLYKYDYPGASGRGRVRPDGFSTDFCKKSGVQHAFERLFDGVANLGVPLILSYPTDGLLTAAGSSVEELVKGRLRLEATHTFAINHSTLGASSGSTTKAATENLYVCRPA